MGVWVLPTPPHIPTPFLRWYFFSGINHRYGIGVMIAAIVLAAGKSERMGRPKMYLPWGDTTVIGQVVYTLTQAGLDEIIIVTGGAHNQVELTIDDLPTEIPVRTIYNTNYTDGEMTISFQVGLSSLDERIEATLFALGDQPQMEVGVVRSILAEYRDTHAALVVPSYRMRRGHPWLIARSLWSDLLSLREPETVRGFLNERSDQIHYVVVDTVSILQDLDTPADYEYFQRRPPP